MRKTGWVLAAQMLAGCMLAGLTAPHAVAADWAPATKSNIGDRYDVDLDTVTRNGDIARSWVRETLQRPMRDERTGKTFVQTVAERFDDCVRRRYATGSFVHHDARGGDAGSGAGSSSAWQEIVPGSVAEGIWSTVCAISSPPSDKAFMDAADEGTWTDLGISKDRTFHINLRLDKVMKIDDRLVLALTRTDYAEPVWMGGLPVRYVIAAEAIDCSTGASGALGGDFYLSRKVRVAAKRIALEKVKLEPATPGSFIANNLKLICNSARASEAADEGRGDSLSVGTAWGVDKGYLVTASHVVHGGSAIEVYDNGEKVGDAQLVAEDATNDLAILKYKPARPGKLTILPLAPHTPGLGRSVFVLGYPAPDALGQKIKMTAGQVSSTAGYQDDPREIQISVPIQQGNSGGPVITWDGTVVGVVEWKLIGFGKDDKGPAPEMINYALKASYVRAMLEELPDLSNYAPVSPGASHDQMVAAARKAVFMVVVSP